MSAKPPFVSEPRCYQVSFDATIPNAHPAALPGERQRVALSRVVTAWDALDAVNQIKMECEREYRGDKARPHWKAVNAVAPYWEAKFGGSDGASLVDEVRPGQEYTLALKLEAALRNHMENYGGTEYAESTIAAIRADVGMEERPKPPHVDPAYAIEAAFVAQKLREDMPSYRCERCHKSARELDNGNWLHRINPGETPSVWMCDICINLPNRELSRQ